MIYSFVHLLPTVTFSFFKTFRCDVQLSPIASASSMKSMAHLNVSTEDEQESVMKDEDMNKKEENVADGPISLQLGLDEEEEEQISMDDIKLDISVPSTSGTTPLQQQHQQQQQQHEQQQQQQLVGGLDVSTEDNDNEYKPGSGRQFKGTYNLVNHLPDTYYIRPDLGPKMYIAYGLLWSDCRASTNMHLDITDAVNVLIDVTRPASNLKQKDTARITAELEGIRIIDELTKNRAKEKPFEVGAEWTIWPPNCNATIRRFCEHDMLDDYDKGLLDAEMKKFVENNREVIERTDDGIHDQCLYLPPCARLYMKARYPDTPNIEGFTIIQMLNDAVFIPAGAAHQVRNILSCTKIAMDFVSPEGVPQSAIITNEARHLSFNHRNRTDKLQLSNIVLHSVLDALNTLEHTEKL